MPLISLGGGRQRGNTPAAHLTPASAGRYARIARVSRKLTLDVEHDIVRRQKSAVIDISNLAPPWVRLFLIDLLIAQLLFGRIHCRLRMDRTEVVFVMDEADADVSRIAEAAFPDGYSTPDQLFSLGREFGIVVILGVRTPGTVSRFVLNSVQYQCFYNLADAESVAEASRTLMLPRGGSQMLPGLKPGEFIFRQSQCGWHHAMLARGDYVPPCRTPKTTPYDTHEFIPSQHLNEMPHVKDALDKLISEHRRAQLKPTRTAKETLSANARKLLDLATIYPFEPVARLWGRAGRVSASAQARAREELETKGFAQFERARIGAADVWLMGVTAAGYELLGKPAPSGWGQMTLAHAHACHWIVAVGRNRGYSAETEWLVPGTTHRADAAWRKAGQWHAFEVVVDCQENLVQHLLKCLVDTDAVASVTVAAPRKSILKGLQKTVDAEPALQPHHDRIGYEAIEVFMKELFS